MSLNFKLYNHRDFKRCYASIEFAWPNDLHYIIESKDFMNNLFIQKPAHAIKT